MPRRSTYLGNKAKNGLAFVIKHQMSEEWRQVMTVGESLLSGEEVFPTHSTDLVPLELQTKCKRRN